MTKIDPATYDETIRRPWHVPGVHERRSEDMSTLNNFPADDYEAALASSEPIPTEPGDLDDTQRSVEGLGFVLAGCTLAGVAAGAALAHLWPAIVAFGMAP